jgi:uncharacterized protein
MRGKKIIITGASSGIGADILKILRVENKVFAVARNVENIEQSENVKAYSCDISSKENIDLLFSNALDFLGDIDVFFANAGFAYYEKIKSADWEHNAAIFNTNVFSSIYSLMRMKELKKEMPFKFVITASAMSFMSIPGYSLYSSTKFALKGFADSFRFELNKDQKLCMSYPVATYTDFFNVAHSEKMPWPRQKSITVARSIVRGANKGKSHIFPCFTFRLGLFLNRIFPVVKLYQRIEGKKVRNNKNI